MEGLGTRAKCGFQSCQINVSLHITSGYCIYIEITFAEFVCRSKYKKACVSASSKNGSLGTLRYFSKFALENGQF